MSTLPNAEKLVEFITTTTHELAIPGTLRSKVAAACFGVALDHHHGITILVSNARYASAFALARPVFESFLRGAWLTHCASNEQVETFSTGCKPLKTKIDTLLAELEENGGYDGKTLSAIKASAWNSMCDYAHTGGLQIQRWQTGDSVEPNYETSEIEEVLAFTNLFACLSAIELVALSGSESQFDLLTKSLVAYLPAAT